MQTNDWKRNFMLFGGLIGAAIGTGTAYLLVRTAEEKGGGRPEITTADFIKAGIGVVGVMRGIAALGDNK